MHIHYYLSKAGKSQNLRDHMTDFELISKYYRHAQLKNIFAYYMFIYYICTYKLISIKIISECGQKHTQS